MRVVLRSNLSWSGAPAAGTELPAWPTVGARLVADAPRSCCRRPSGRRASSRRPSRGRRRSGASRRARDLQARDARAGGRLEDPVGEGEEAALASPPLWTCRPALPGWRCETTWYAVGWGATPKPRTSDCQALFWPPAPATGTRRPCRYPRWRSPGARCGEHDAPTIPAMARSQTTPPRPTRARGRPNALLACGSVPPVTDLPLIASGKVREMYDLGDRILMVASDRISTYDVVHPTPIPDKGRVLTGLSAFWFARTGHIVPNHFVSATEDVPDEVRGRAMVVRKLRMLPVECVVRGYITGSGWKDYQATGERLGHRAAARPARVRAAARRRSSRRRRRPTRATTRRSTSSAPRELVGDRDLMAPRARRVDRAVPLRRRARARARRDPRRHEVRVRPRRRRRARRRRRGAHARLLALLAGRRLRGRASGQPSFDKQYVRDWARGSGWDKTPPAPALPDDVVAGHARALRRGLRADHRRAVRRVAGAGPPP